MSKWGQAIIQPMDTFGKMLMQTTAATMKVLRQLMVLS